MNEDKMLDDLRKGAFGVNHAQLKCELPSGLEIINKNTCVIVDILEEVKENLDSAFLSTSEDYRDECLLKSATKIETMIKFIK